MEGLNTQALVHADDAIGPVRRGNKCCDNSTQAVPDICGLDQGEFVGHLNYIGDQLFQRRVVNALRLSMSSEVDSDESENLAEMRNERVPGRPVLGDAVKENKGGAVSLNLGNDFKAIDRTNFRDLTH